MSYFKKTLEKLPCSKELLESIDIDENRDGFYKCFSIAKMCVNCEVEIKKYKGINMIFNIVSGLVGKVVHTNFVQPYVTGMIDGEDLSRALIAYQTEINSGEEPNELQCVAYLIQTELENEKPLRIPNPMFGGINRQITAVSKYIVELVKSVANKKMKKDLSKAGPNSSKLQ